MCQNEKGRIFLIRHGKTNWNEEGRLQGQLDSPLLESSHASIKAIGDTLEGIGFARLFRSPMLRVESSLSLMDKLKLQSWEVLDELKEISFGAYAGFLLSDLPESFQLERKRSPWETRWPEGESCRDVWLRTKAFADDLKKMQGDICIFAHETVNRVLIGHFLDLEPQLITSSKQPNDVIYQIHDGRIKWNKVGHTWSESNWITKI